jgi:hypothetical protein
MSSSTRSTTPSTTPPPEDHFTIYIASIQATLEAPIKTWKIILAPPTNEDCIFCDIVLLDGNKYAPLTIRRGETFRMPFVVNDKIVHLSIVCTAPVTKAQMVINEAHFAIHGSQVWTLSFLTALEDERIAPWGTVGYYENLMAVEEVIEDFEIN